jgi:sugar lactone lactonase YvrE
MKKILLFILCLSGLVISGNAQVGAVSTLAGSTQGYLDATGTSAQLNNPAGICLSPDGTTLYFSDTQNHRVRKIIISTAQVTTIAGSGIAGTANGISTAAQFNFPNGICISPDGSFLYVADKENHKIRKINLTTNAVSTFAGTGTAGGTDAPGQFAKFRRPSGICITPDGNNLYIADGDNHLIRKISLSTGDSLVSTFAGAGFAAGGGWTDAVGTAAKFFNPKGIAISADGLTLYVGDESNHRVRKIVISSVDVSTIAGTGIAGSGDGTGTAAEVSYPSGLTVSPDGQYIYLADFGNTRIRKIDTGNLAVTTLAGSSSGYVDNTIGTSAQFAGPTDIVIDPTNTKLYLADRQNNRIRTVLVSTTSGINNHNDFANLIKVYPTLTSGILNIKMDFPINENFANVSIYNLLGEKLYGFSLKNVVNEQLTLNINSLMPGSYIVVVSTSEQTISKKICKISE